MVDAITLHLSKIKGLRVMSRTSGEQYRGITKTTRTFNQALQYDPSFALAYVGLGHVYWKKSYLPENDSLSLMDSVLVLANIALSYDDKLAEAYYLRGAYFYFEKGDLEKTEEEWDKAIKVNPNQWHVYAGKRWLPSTDLITQIENQIKAASLNHDIGFSDLLSDIGWSFFEAGFPEKASFYYNEVLKLDGDSVRYLYSLADCEQYIAGNYNKSLELLGKICAIDSAFSKLDRLFALNYMFTGQFEKSLLHLKRLKSAGRIHEIVSRSDDPDSHYNIACIYAVRGEREKAIEHLKLFNQYENKGKLSSVTYIKNDPLFDNIRNEPEFQQIVSDMEAKYQAEHERVRKWMEEQGMFMI
jgi:tetratricopeptide (TPR) repeat protein